MFNKNNINKKYKAPLSHLLNPGHSACAGCGMIIAARLVFDAAGPNTIAANATGCSEVTTTPYPMTSFKVPWIHSLFENPAALASGICAALRYQKLDDKINVLAIGGDGATFDIGIPHISGMWERGDNVLYICYDNEAYQNTGAQSSGSTPLDASTTTAPAGKNSFGSKNSKKDMIKIALAHNLPYIATASVGYPMDITNKVKKALTFKGPKYLQIYASCVPGWGIEPKDSLNVAKRAVQNGFYPIVEYIRKDVDSQKSQGVISAPAADADYNLRVMKITKKEPVDEFLRLQKRFKHLFSPQSGSRGAKEIAEIQRIADRNIEKFGLMN